MTRRRGVAYADVRRAALALPDVEESASHGPPALRARGAPFARANGELDELVIRTTASRRDALVARDPKTYAAIERRAGPAMVLVRLARLVPADLPELVRVARDEALGIVRCAWASHEPLVTYHDREWGVPVHDDRALFELLSLEGAQAGLSWETVLRKRDGYRRAFRDFDVGAVARFGEREISRALADPGIVRHRGKIVSVVANAAAIERVRRDAGSFDAYLWAFVDGCPVVTRDGEDVAVAPTSALSHAVSRDLRARGFAFVGPTIVQSFLQAAGIRDDHRADCFRASPRKRTSSASTE